MARRGRPAAGPLDGRSQAVLRAVIEEYVASATPVGSQALVERYRLGVSSATVRAVLADLETAGLLTHPHTSAGRILTDRGYRLYVETLVELHPTPAVEQPKIHHSLSVRAGGIRQRALVPACRDHPRLSSPARPAWPQRPSRVPPGSAGWTSWSWPERMASLVLVLREGTIKQGLLQLDEPADQAVLDRVAERLNPGARRAHRGRVEDRLPDRSPRPPSRPIRGRSWPSLDEARLVHRVGRADRPHDARVRRRHCRGGLQRRPPQRHGRARVRPEPEAPPGLLGPREPVVPRRAPPARRRDRGGTPRLHRPGERPRRDARGVARPGPLRSARSGRSAWSASWGPLGWPTRTRSAPSASCPG